MPAQAATLEQPGPGARRQQLHAHVASSTPCRLRLRVHSPQQHRELVQTTQQGLSATDGIERVDVNTRTGSLLVHYDPNILSAPRLLAILRDLGVTLVDAERGLDPAPPGVRVSRPSRASMRIVAAVGDLDRQIALLSGHKVDLKLLAPLALGAVGVWQLSRRGTGLNEVPAYVVLWYAFDSFWKFHHSPARSRQDGAAG